MRHHEGAGVEVGVGDALPGPGCLLGDGGHGVHLGRVVHHQVVIAGVQGQSATYIGVLNTLTLCMTKGLKHI